MISNNIRLSVRSKSTFAILLKSVFLKKNLGVIYTIKPIVADVSSMNHWYQVHYPEKREVKRKVRF